MEPPHLERRAVWGIPLETQPVPPVNDMISSLLRCKHGCCPLLLSFLLHPPRLLCACICLRRRRQLWCRSSRSPRRQVGEKALFVVRGRHSVNRRIAVARPQLTEPRLCTVSRRWKRACELAAQRAGKHATRNASMNRRCGLGRCQV